MRPSNRSAVVAFALTCIVPGLARAEEVVPGVDFFTLDYDGTEVYVVTIDRAIDGYEFRVLGAKAGPGKLYTRTVEDLAEEAGAVVAINGYFFGGPEGTEKDQVVTPLSTLIIEDEEFRDCYTNAKKGCKFDLSILGFGEGTSIGMFTSPGFQKAESDAYHHYAVGSDFPFLVSGECFAGKPYDKNGRTAVGFNADTVFFLTTEPVTGLWTTGLDRTDLCGLMIALGAENAAMLDGGPAVGMVVDGEHVNPLTAPLSWKYGPARHVANAIGLVKTQQAPPGDCPSGDGLYCGGPVGLDAEKLYACVDSDFIVSEVCEDGCTVAPPGENDYCSPVGGSCPNGNGLYCGESVGLTPGTLYSCADGAYKPSMVCPDGCADAGVGNNDYCSNSPCECNSGECCDGCYFRPLTHVCDQEVQYGCLGNGCGADVGVQLRDHHCSGGSASCDGALGDWSGQSLHTDCTASQTCDGGGDTCQDDAMCMQCTDTYSVTDHACYTFTSANGQGPGGGENIEICGEVDAQGKVTVRARKYDGTTFGSRPYQVRVSPPGDAPCGPDTYIYKISNTEPPAGINTSKLTFEFDSIWLDDQWEKGYCVTASTKVGDVGYDPNSDQQQSWWYSDKFTLKRMCN